MRPISRVTDLTRDDLQGNQMTDFEQHDREQRQLMVEFLLEAVRYLAQISTPVLLAVIRWKLW
jgi:hypothetical protein